MATERLQVPDPVLQDLRCCICAQYLSVFPVHMSPSLGAICGRCPIEENIYDAVRNTTYEKAIEIFRFPCCNDGFGCVEKLVPSMISAHEKICKFRQVKCPCIQSECDWKGPCTTVVDHFEDKHLVFLMKQPDFEVNFINTINEVYILLYEEEIFLFQRKADGHKNTLWYSLEYFGWNEKPDSFSYQVTLTDMNKKFSKKYPKQRTIKLNENVTEIVAADVKNDLSNPSVIVGSIEITINDITDQNKSNGHDVKHKEISNQMLKILECPVCFEYMIPPIFQCLGGHSICSVCKNDVAECPQCKQPLKNTRNFVMESMTKHILYPCRHADKGCNFSIDGTKIRQHEKFCEFGSVLCPFNACSYQCRLSSLMSHIHEKHTENVLEFDVISEPLDDGFDEMADCYALKYLDKIFIVYFKAENNAFCWSFQLLGSPELVNSYKCEIDILDNTNNGQRIYLKGPCSEYTTAENAFDNNCYLQVNYDQVKRMITDTFSYRIRVVKDVAHI